MSSDLGASAGAAGDTPGSIVYLFHEPYGSTVGNFLEGRGKALQGILKPISYLDLVRDPRGRMAGASSVIFTDYDRMTPVERHIFTATWESLAAQKRPVRLLNHPKRSMQRYELLRNLHVRGVNGFNAYRYHEFKDIRRFPVFLRVENDHGGARSTLIANRAQLIAEFDRCYGSGINPGELLAVEYRDTADSDGVYRKYGAFVIGGEIIPSHLKFSREWHIKSSDLYTEALQAEELAYVTDNPFRDQLAPIATMARIDYGRFDYTVVDGRVVVWEINNNPQIEGRGVNRPERQAAFGIVMPRIEAALRRLSLPPAATQNAAAR